LEVRFAGFGGEVDLYAVYVEALETVESWVVVSTE
jgi:hypothetical protein